MVPMDDLPELRAAVPALEPDAVLLGQLVELSAASAAADTAARTRLRPARALITGAAALGLVAATSWIAGALPGVPSPIVPEQAPPPAPTAPATPHRTSDARVPSASAGPTSGAPTPHTRAPDVVPSGPGTGTGAGSPPKGRPSAAPTRPGGRVDSQRPGRHRGQDQRGDTPGSKDDRTPKDNGQQKDNGRHRGEDKPHPTPSASAHAHDGTTGPQHGAGASSPTPDSGHHGNRTRAPGSDRTTGP
jgi:hypothetical protein